MTLKTKHKENIFGRLPLIASITATAYFLYFYLFIHTVVTQQPCEFLDEIWLGGTTGHDHPLGLFSLIVVLLAVFTVADFIQNLTRSKSIQYLPFAAYLLILCAHAYWGYSLFKLSEFTKVERGEISPEEYLNPVNSDSYDFFKDLRDEYSCNQASNKYNKFVRYALWTPQAAPFL